MTRRKFLSFVGAAPAAAATVVVGAGEAPQRMLVLDRPMPLTKIDVDDIIGRAVDRIMRKAYSDVLAIRRANDAINT